MTLYLAWILMITPTQHDFYLTLQHLGMTEECTLDNMNRWAQENLLRSGERWHEQGDKFELQRRSITPLLTKLGFINEVPPTSKKYKGVIIHGATLPSVALRLEYLAEQWRKGLRFEHLYFLSGERPLLESEKTGSATTECEMIREHWNKTTFPASITPHFINAPAKENGARPNSSDTVQAWLATKPPAGSYLAISNNPHILRQHLATQALLPNTYTLDTAGPAASPSAKVSTLLDEVARTIFEIKKTTP